jgi:phage head maturation protease
VFEVSAVTFPAYEATSITARGLSDALDSAKASLESAKAERREVERKKRKLKMLMEVNKWNSQA